MGPSVPIIETLRFRIELLSETHFSYGVSDVLGHLSRCDRVSTGGTAGGHFLEEYQNVVASMKSCIFMSLRRDIIMGIRTGRP